MNIKKRLAKLQRLAIAPAQIQDRLITLTPQQHHYLSRVLRLPEGDRFIAMDGLGHWWLATLAGTTAEILEPLSVQTELPVAVTLMVAPPKGNGFDEVVRYCTQLGAAGIVPVASDRTLLNPGSQKLDRWRRIAAEAAEQSERQIVPTILEPVPFAAAISSVEPSAHRYLCVARGDAPHLLGCLQETYPQPVQIAIATGPEGGWTPQEVETAIAHCFKPVSLGRRILQAVIAPAIALSLVAAAFESNHYA